MNNKTKEQLKKSEFEYIKKSNNIYKAKIFNTKFPFAILKRQ